MKPTPAEILKGKPRIHKNKTPPTADKGIAEIIISKHRNGPTGVIRVAFIGKYTKFANLSRQEP